MKDEAEKRNAESLKTLIRSIRLFQGDFSLILAHCNYEALRCQTVELLIEQCPIEIKELTLEPSAKTLYHTIAHSLGKECPQALMVSGLESVVNIDKLLSATNQVREDFRNFAFPMVLWITDDVLQKLIRLIPDFHSWSTKIRFVNTTEELVKLIEHTTDDVFAKLIDLGVGTFIDSIALNLKEGSRRRLQLEFAMRDLQERGVQLDPHLAASLEFVLGQDIRRSLQERWQHYQQSLNLWHQGVNQDNQTIANLADSSPLEILSSLNIPPSYAPQLIERIGCLWFYMGLWWRSYGVANPAEYLQGCDRSCLYFKKLMEFFRFHQRQDLEAKFINGLGEVLQRLERWEELAPVAQHALSLHQSLYSQRFEADGNFGTGDGFRLAHDYLLLADVNLAKGDSHQAQCYVEQAIKIHEYAQEVSLANQEPHQYLEWRNKYHQELYFLTLARALVGLGAKDKAIAKLEIARSQGNPQFDPRLYLRILQQLYNLHWEKRQYHQAFTIKRQRSSLEQQYQFRAFVGSPAIKPFKAIAIPALPGHQNLAEQLVVSAERKQEVTELLERLQRYDCQLMVTHGEPKVGKTSLLQAGLVPVLQQTTIENREVVPIFISFTPQWLALLAQQLAGINTCSQVENESKINNLVYTDTIIANLQQNAQDNFLTVLIFDQLESFLDPHSPHSRTLTDLLWRCIKLPYVNIILSLRSDYLPYLPQLNLHWQHHDCMANLAIMSQQPSHHHLFYRVGNFSKNCAKFALEKVTREGNFPLESQLIEQLVTDLANSDGEVKPLELQLVGLQLQSQGITTLTEYQRQGAKSGLLQQYTTQIIEDCGQPNESTAKLVLNLLADQSRSKFELLTASEVNTAQLDLVLSILVDAGLIWQIPDGAEMRYQSSALVS